jgi:hypothetical protein
MIWFIIELIILFILGIKMIILLVDDNVSNIKENFYEYIGLTIPFSILLIITIFTGCFIFDK